MSSLSAGRSWLNLALFVILGACSTTIKTIESRNFAQISEGATGVILPLELKSEHEFSGKSGCTLFLFSDRDVKTYEIDIKLGEQVLFAPLPNGTYGIKWIGCIGDRWDARFWSAPNFRSFAGKLSLVGQWEVTIDQNKTLRFAGSGSKNQPSELQKVFDRLSQEHQANVVSAYTGAPILSSMFGKSGKSGWEFKALTRSPVKPNKNISKMFESCFHSESNINWIQLGRLDVILTFDQGQLAKMDLPPSQHTFSNSFVDCVKDKITHMRPRHRAPHQYFIHL